jgi:hypothetical protein
MDLRLIVMLLFLVFVLSMRVPAGVEEFRDGTESFVQSNIVPDTRTEANKWLIN